MCLLSWTGAVTLRARSSSLPPSSHYATLPCCLPPWLLLSFWKGKKMSSQISSVFRTRRRNQMGGGGWGERLPMSIPDQGQKEYQTPFPALHGPPGKLHCLMGGHRMTMVVEPEGSCSSPTPSSPSPYRWGNESRGGVATCLKSQS